MTVFCDAHLDKERGWNDCSRLLQNLGLGVTLHG